MKEPKKASFGFRKFTVPTFSYRNSEKSKSDLKLYFDPKGDYDASKGRYYLTLNFQGNETSDSKPIIEVICVAEFEFSEKIEISEIPEYFYSNAIAIMFPYLRAFVSTLTLQANTGLIMLETLNLSSLKDVLKQNTKLKLIEAS